MLLCLGACAPRISSAPPQTVVQPPEQWRTALGGETAPLARDWWQQFDDVVLTRLVETALTNNTDIAISVARVQEARAQQALARAQQFPSFDAGAGITASRSVGPLGQPMESIGAQPIFQAAYEVDLFGRLREQVSAAQASYLASAAARDATALSVAAATASAYLNLRGLDARRNILLATVASRQEALRIARDRSRVGYTSQLELRQAEAEYEGTAQAIPSVDLAISRQENALNVLLGTSPRDIERGLAIAALREPLIPAGLPSDLLRRRPDIAQAEFALSASDATLAASRAQFLPQVRLTGSTGVALSSALGDPIALWSLGASVLAPLFEGGRLRAQLDAATARRDQAAFDYRRAVMTAFREVEDALAAVQRLREQRQRLAAQRRAVAEALRHAINRYQAGYSSYLEQLDAQRALLSVELSLVETEVDTRNALVALYQAMGGGWTAESLPLLSR
jgi:outer membrane protein, multidrug efflux system